MRRARGISIRDFVVMVAGAVVGGCAIFGGRPAPVVPPAVNATVTQFAGTPLSGPTANSVGDSDLTRSVRVEVTWLAQEKFPETALPPVDTRSRLTFSPVSSETVRSGRSCSNGNWIAHR